MPRRKSATENGVHNDYVSSTNGHAEDLAPPPPSSALLALRHNWQWAATSQFLTMFKPVLGREQILLQDVEQDIASGTRVALPKLMGRLLNQLNQDRKITSENWQPYLRRQYLRRAPDKSPFPVPRKRAATIDADNTEGAMDETRLSEVGDAARSQPDVTSPKNEYEPELVVTTQDTVGEDVFGSMLLSLPQKHENNEEQIQAGQDDADDNASEQEEEFDWYTLPADAKMHSLHTLCEWLSHNRIRNTMKDDDERARWRIQPVGYDENFDAYWFLGGDRLWIQHRQNQPIRVRTGIKRKRSTVASRQRKRMAVEVMPPKRVGRSTRTSARAGNEALPIDPPPRRKTRTSRRAAEEDAWQEIPEEWLRPPESTEPETVNGTSMAASSSSLNSVNGNLPNGDGTTSDAGTGEVERDGVAEADVVKRETGSLEPNDTADVMLDLDSGSELTELSSEGDGEGDDDDEEEAGGDEDADDDESAEEDSDGSVEFISDYKPPATPPPDFVEWETVCVTRAEWEEFPTRFENSTNRHERTLLRRLVNDVLPRVMEAFKEEDDRVRALADTAPAVKRSSRIAQKESTRVQGQRGKAAPQASSSTVAQAGSSKPDRAARAEQRARRGEQERLKRELEQDGDGDGNGDGDDDGVKKERTKSPARSETVEDSSAKAAPNGRAKRPPPKKAAAKPPPTKRPRRTYEEEDDDDEEEEEEDDSGDDYDDGKDSDYEDDEDWELDCEICGKQGRNVNDGLAVACCEKCNKWQHMKCHDEVDERAGRKPRKWDEIDFTCRACAAKMRQRSSPQKSHSQPSAPSQQSTFQVQPTPQVIQQFAQQLEQARRPDGSYDTVAVQSLRSFQLQYRNQQVSQLHVVQQQMQQQLNQAAATGYTTSQLQQLQAQLQQRLLQQQQQVEQVQAQMQTMLSNVSLTASTSGSSQGASPQEIMYQHQQRQAVLMRQQQLMQQQQHQQQGLMPAQQSLSSSNMIGSNPHIQQQMYAQQQLLAQRQGIGDGPHIAQGRVSPAGGMLQQIPQQNMALQQVAHQQRLSSHSPVQQYPGSGLGSPDHSGRASPMMHSSPQQMQQPTMQGMPTLLPPGHPQYAVQQQQINSLKQQAQTSGLSPQQQQVLRAIMQQQQLQQQQQQQQHQQQQLGGMSGVGIMGAGGMMGGTNVQQSPVSQLALQQQMIQHQAAQRHQQQQQQQWQASSQDLSHLNDMQLRFLQQQQLVQGMPGMQQISGNALSHVSNSPLAQGSSNTLPAIAPNATQQFMHQQRSAHSQSPVAQAPGAHTPTSGYVQSQPQSPAMTLHQSPSPALGASAASPVSGHPSQSPVSAQQYKTPTPPQYIPPEGGPA